MPCLNRTLEVETRLHVLRGVGSRLGPRVWQASVDRLVDPVARVVAHGVLIPTLDAL